LKPTFVYVDLITEDNYRDCGVCGFDISAEVKVTKELYGADADGNRGIYEYDYEVTSATIQIDIYDDDGNVVNSVVENENILSNDIIELLIEEARSEM
jgi:hypothetical protein